MNKKLIARANELYYDLMNGDYEEDHREILLLTLSRLKKISDSLFNHWIKKNNRVVVDIGSGTGFVPLSIASDLNENDFVICTDIYEGMLKKEQENLESAGVKFKRTFLKSDGINYPVADEVADVVMANSMLHHVSDPEAFFKEVSRIAKKGGYFVLSHEPNAKFQNNKVLWTIYRILYLLYNPRALFESLNRRGWLKTKITEIKNQNEAISEINQILIKEGFISSPLSEHKLNMLVEINSIKGFFIEDIKKMLPLFKLIQIETYNHLWWIYINHHRNPFIRAIDAILKIIYPYDGKSMILVFQKNETNVTK